MPKLKTTKSVKRRFKVTGTGKVLARSGGKRHLLTSKRAKRKRQLKGARVISAADTKRLRSLLS